MRVALCALALLAVLCVAMPYWSALAEVGGLTDQVEQLLERIEEDMQTMVTTWNSSSGQQRVETVREADEGHDAFARRHKEAVIALQLLFPVVP